VELTVLGCSGSYNGADGRACSGYLVREGDSQVWIDCGTGTFGELQRRMPVDELSAVVLTHEHPDHVVDVYGLHVMMRYALGRKGLPVYAPAGLDQQLGTLVQGDWGGTFSWQAIDSDSEVNVGALTMRFSRTDHPPPTYAVELSGNGSRLVYSSDTGPGWSVEAFAGGADLVLSEATYLHDEKPAPIHLSAKEAGAAARAAGARKLMLTHLWPLVDRPAAVAEGSAAYGEPVVLAEPGQTTII